MIFPRRCDTCRRYREQLKTERDKYEKLLAEKDKQLEEARDKLAEYKLSTGYHFKVAPEKSCREGLDKICNHCLKIRTEVGKRYGHTERVCLCAR